MEMKKKIINKTYKLIVAILLFANCGMSYSVQAIEPINERVYVRTDKEVYLAGENLWSKLYVTNLDGAISSFSKIAYLELIGDSTPFIQQKIDLINGEGDTRIHLPVNLATGNYRLVGYTRAMRNEGEQVFFNKTVTVYNTFTSDRIGSEKARPSVTAEETASLAETSLIKTNKPIYTNREQGQISLRGIDKDNYSISLSVVRKEELPGLPLLSINRWKQNIQNKQEQHVPAFIPEYEGHIVTGTIIAEDSLPYNPKEELLIPLIAFPGKGIGLFSGRIEPNEQVSFFTKRIDGTQDAITSVLSVSGKTFRVDIQSPFASHSYKEFPSVAISDTLKNALLERSIGIQAMQAFYGDTIWNTSYGAAHVVGKPDWVYKLDEYTRFTTMAEVVTEFVLGLRFRKINNQRFLSVLTEERTGFTTANSLVLLDGVPLLDHESIYTYDPLLVEQIEIYRGKHIFGGQIFDGIVYFKTYHQDYKGAKLDPSSQLFTYRGTESRCHFFVPDYTDQSRRNSRLPDLRHTLLWEPTIQTGGQETINIPFFTSDLKGEFIVTIEGISKTGRIIRSTANFRVE